MSYPGLTIFLVFFGISLLDALWGGHWTRAIFWVSTGVVFFIMDRSRRAGRADRGSAHPSRQ
jgi:hypothetical protein